MTPWQGDFHGIRRRAHQQQSRRRQAGRRGASAGGIAKAQRLAAQPPVALALAKSLLDHGMDSSVPDAFEREVDAAIATMATDEAQVGAEAFRERSGE